MGPRCRGLPAALAGNRRGARGGGVRIEVGAARNHRPQAGVEVVAQRDPGRDVQPDDRRRRTSGRGT